MEEIERESINNKSDVPTILYKALKCFSYGFLLRFTLSVLSNKLNLNKVLQLSNLKGILKFAIMSGMLSFLYKITRHLLDRFKIMEGNLDR